MRLAPGMLLEVGILRIGQQPISGQTTTCGVLAADVSPREVIKFGAYENNQLFVYVRVDGRGRVRGQQLDRSQGERISGTGLRRI
jgi:hypothetical protein